MPPRCWRPLFVVLTWIAFSGVAVADPVSERLTYSVSYRGVFSLGQSLRIADVRLETRTLPGDAGLVETRLEADSQAYPTVEALYPIRYRFRSWLTPGVGELVGFETLEQGRKHRHRLYLRDDSLPGVRAFNLIAGAGSDEMARLDAGDLPSDAPPGDLLFDRLGLLQRVRRQEMREDAQYRFPVTNGRDRLVYRVTVEGAERLALEGLTVPAWKLRFDGYEVTADGGETPAHRPVHIWLSQSPALIPLRADSEHPVGVFRILLDPPSALEHLADAMPDDLPATAGPLSRPASGG